MSDQRSAAIDALLRGSGPKLSFEEEDRLAVAAKAGCARSMDTLCRSHLKFVLWVATQQRRRGVAAPLEDLVAAGLLGLVEAVKRYDPTRESSLAGRKSRFTAAASWSVRRAIQTHLHREVPVVPLSRTPALAAMALSKTWRLENRLGRRATVAELAELGSCTEQVVVGLLGRGPDLTLDYVAAAADPEAECARAELLERARAVLTARQREVLELLLAGHSMVDVSAELGISKQRVQQLKNAALARVESAA